MKNINEIVKKTKIKFFRKDMDFQFFGILLYKFNWLIHIFEKEFIEGYVHFNNKTKQLEDGAIHINKAILEKDDYNHDNLMALLIHELLHILNKHAIRQCSRKNNELWALACDHETDSKLKLMNNIKPYNNVFNIIHDLPQNLKSKNAEKIYDWLKEHSKSYSIDKGENSAKITDKNSGKIYNVSLGENVVSPPNKIDRNNVKSLTENFLSQARAINDTMRARGHTNGTFDNLIKNLLEVKIPWTDILDKAIKNNITMNTENRGWQKLHNMYLPLHINLPGYVSLEEKNAVGKLIILIDTSGSVSINELKQFAYIIKESLKFFKETQIICHDTIIHQKKSFYNNEELEFLTYMDTIGFKGRGGTSHTDVFKYIEENDWYDLQLRDVLSIVISLTDGESNIERIYNNYKWISEIPFVIIITGQKKLRFNNKNNIKTITIN